MDFNSRRKCKKIKYLYRPLVRQGITIVRFSLPLVWAQVDRVQHILFSVDVLGQSWTARFIFIYFLFSYFRPPWVKISRENLLVNRRLRRRELAVVRGRRGRKTIDRLSTCRVEVTRRDVLTLAFQEIHILHLINLFIYFYFLFAVWSKTHIMLSLGILIFFF